MALGESIAGGLGVRFVLGSLRVVICELPATAARCSGVASAQGS